jgi:hypothetical protein
LQPDKTGTAPVFRRVHFCGAPSGAHVRKDIYDLVESAAAQRGIPRLELWQKALRAIENGELEACIDERLRQPHGWPSWIAQARAAVDRYNDPNSFAHILKLITVTVADFNQWIRTSKRMPRGPRHGTTGFRDADRKLFPEISKLIDTGQQRSPYGAALVLADQKKIAGTATRARAKERNRES